MSGRTAAIKEAVERLRASPFFSLALQNSAWLFADRLLRIGVAFAVTAWVARHLGPSEFGLLNYSMAVAALVGPLCGLGLEAVMVRELVRRPADEMNIVETGFALRCIAATAGTAIAAVLAFALSAGDAQVTTVVTVLASATFFQSSEAVDYGFQAKSIVRPIAIAKSSAMLLASAVKVWLISVDADLVYFAGVSALETSIGAAFMLLSHRVHLRRPVRLRLDRSTARVLVLDGAPLILSGLLVTLFLRLDQILLARWATMEDVGKYAAALRIMEVWTLVPALVFKVIYPKLVQTAADRRQFETYVQYLFRAGVVLAGAFCALNALLAKLAIELLYGPEYAASVPVAILLSLSLFFAFSGEVRAQVLFILNLKRYHVSNALVGIAVLVPMAAVLIPLWGPIGAAATVVAAYIASGMVSSFLFQETRWIGVMQVRALMFWRGHHGRE